MATFMNTQCVKYEFNTDKSASLCELFFCRHCLKLKSKQCVTHEVDSLFCPNCLENMAYGEAKLKKNRCATCFDCPCCGHALSTRATSVKTPSETSATDESSKVPKKAFYLACSYCRWSSRDAGLKDQSIATGGWQEQVNPHAARIASLVEHYNSLCLSELQEKESGKLRRKSYFVDKVGLGQFSIKRRVGFGLNLMKDSVMQVPVIEASKASDSYEQLPDHYYTQAPDLTAVTSIQQRLTCPEFQPSLSSKMHPLRKHLLNKRSMRCKDCEHNLSKPEFTPSVIKFKIQLIAIHHIPEVRILKLPPILKDQSTRLIITFNNPLETLLRIQLSVPEIDQESANKLTVPTSELQISKNDEAAELDESPSYDDDPQVIAYRKGNKIGVFVDVISGRDVGEDVIVKMNLKHNYVKKVLSVPGTDKDNKEKETIWLQHVVTLNLGKVVSE